jgi:hypothetical protein
VGRHRHAVNVRVDGLAVVLGPLLGDARIVAAVLVDVDSGMVLDAWSAAARTDGPPDLEVLGAQHAEVARSALALLREWPGGADASGGCEIVLGPDDGVRHLLRTVPDPHGDRLALAVVVDGPQRVLDRVRKRLRSVAVDALTAGPSVTRRPVLGTWSFAMSAPDVAASPEHPAGVPRGPGTAGPAAAAGAFPDREVRGREVPDREVPAGRLPDPALAARAVAVGNGAPSDGARSDGARSDGARTEGVPGPTGFALPAARRPAPARPDPTRTVPLAPLAAAPPRVARVEGPPHPRPTPAVPEPAPAGAAPVDAGAVGVARRPSPPAALPAPAPPRPRER